MAHLARVKALIGDRLPESVRRRVARLVRGSSEDPADASVATKRGGGALQDVKHARMLALAGPGQWDELLAQVRSMVRDKEHVRAQSVIAGLTDDRRIGEIGSLVGGVVAANQKRYRLAVDHFDRSDEQTALDLAPTELLTSLLTVDRERGTALVRRLVGEGRDLPAESWWVAVRHTFPESTRAENEALLERLEAAYRADPSAWSAGELKIPWLRRWVGRERNGSLPSAPASTVSFGVVDYGQPDRSWASQNIGDYIQTIAALGHVVRHRNLAFNSSDAELLALTNELAERVRPELVLDSVDAEVDLHLVDRDASTYQSFPESTWLLAFGWFMHPLFNIDGSFDFPLHPNLKPIIVSFHCNKRSLLTPQALEYLRANGPIGCRDWTTVDLLLSVDVPAFFSGCLTTTVNTVFPDLDSPRPETGTVYVDVVRSPVPDGVENVRQRIPAIKKRTFVRNMRDAIDLLEGYRRDYHDVVTTRLHCYLPATSIGMPVRFEPNHNADVRFNGLFRLDAEEFEAIRTPMRERLRPVLEAIFSGADEEHVRQVWKDTNEADVQRARDRHAAKPAIEGAGAHLLPSRPGGADDVGPTVLDIVLVPRRGQLSRIGPVLRSAARHADGAVRAWVLSTKRAPVVEGVDVRWVDISRLGDGKVGAEAVALASIAELVPASRAVLLPVNALVEADLADLLSTDLGGAAIAARASSTTVGSGFATLYQAGDAWDAEPERAFELYRDIHGRHAFDFDAFDTDVLVLDLQRLREIDAAAVMLDAMVSYALTVRQAWHYLVGPQRANLTPTWAFVPTRDPAVEPGIWVWADGGKPWDSSVLVQGKDRWRAYA